MVLISQMFSYCCWLSCRTFDHIGIASYQLFILLTTENFPVRCVASQYKSKSKESLSLSVGIYVSSFPEVRVVFSLLW